MSSSANTRVLHRDPAWRWLYRALGLLLSLLALGLAWALEGVAPPLRIASLALVLAGVLRSSWFLHHTVTLDREGLRRGSSRWPWEALTSLRPAPHRRWPTTGPLGGLTLRFGDKTVRFGYDWPLESLVEEVFSRVPLESHLKRALDQKEREHGLDFGAVWLGPHGLEPRNGAKTGSTVALRDVREVALDFTDRRTVLRVGDGKAVLTVPLATLRDPHLLAALLIRHGSRGRDTPRMTLTVKHPPRANERPPGLRRWTLGTVFQLGLGLLVLFSAFALGAMAVGMIMQRYEAHASHHWRPVPAEITSSRTWTTHERVSEYRGRYSAPRYKTRVDEHGAIQFRFVLDGVEYEGTRYEVGGTRAEQAARFRVGQQVTAYVPPDAPGQAVLQRGTSSSRLGFVLQVFFLVVLMTASFLFGVGVSWGAFSPDQETSTPTNRS